jgi:hypothetical protein
MDKSMYRNIFLSILFVNFIVASPASAAAQPADGATDCATEERPQGQQVRNDGKALGSAAEPGRPAPEKCVADNADSHADIWMLGMLMLGGLIIGVPAARRRNVRVVFS